MSRERRGPTSGIDAYLRQMYPVLDALDMNVNRFDGEGRLLRVTLSPGARRLVVGSKIWTPYRTPSGIKERFGWEYRASKESSFIGFASGVVAPEAGTSGAILHLIGHVTDDQTSIGARIKDIEAVHEFSKDAAENMAHFQNAEEDGATSLPGVENSGMNVWVTAAELRPFVTTYLPRPERIFPA